MLSANLLVLALAADPPVLLYAPPLDDALTRVHQHTELTDVTPRRLTELVPDGPPLLVGPTALSEHTCGPGPHTNAQILRILAEADELRLAMRVEEVESRLEAGVAVWQCLDEPADAAPGARLFFLLGVHRFASGDAEAARQAFAAALRSNPSLAWDADFPPDARPLFDSLRDTPPAADHVLQLVPGLASVGMRVDRRAVVWDGGQTHLSAGPHLIQLQSPTNALLSRHWVTVSGPGYVVVPAALDDAMTAEVGRPRVQQELDGVLAAAGMQQAVVVPTERAVWMRDTDGWREVRVPVVERLGLPLLIGGAVLAVGGGAWAVVERSTGQDLAGQVGGSTNTAAYSQLSTDYSAARRRYSVATAISTTGVLSLGASTAFLVIPW
jgi:hypothetical protein